MKSVKAYRSNRFIKSDEARPIRILSEYLEPLHRLERQGIDRTIIVFGSARLKPEHPHYQNAVALAEKLARWTINTHFEGQRYFLCTGGGPGIMQAVHEGGAKVDKNLNMGLNIALPFEQHVNPYVQPQQAFEFHYFFMRKFWFLKQAKAAIVFPGGFGTFDELFELLTLVQTGKTDPMPTVLFGSHFWKNVVNWDILVQEGLISPQDLKLFCITDDLEEAFLQVTRGL